ncbi:MAG TPA: glycosyltransferase family 39 protein [Candidatus Sulfopaludibacter sp.]|jgi:hypothetical protein|nr:glycosyltransferase family 39 protein [Candidatus Sulfopaludibacter sp.]
MSKKKANPAPPDSPAASRVWKWVDSHSVLFFVAVMLFASLRIVSTYTIFNHTGDEPAHVACGMEWLEKGTYHIEPQHPPLARVAAALGPYLLGLRGHGADNFAQEGALILYDNNKYDRNLAAARLGILPFFWICSAVVYLWARRYLGYREAAFALLLFTFIPSVLAHAGLATTDMALTAFLSAAFLSGLVWAERPELGRAAVFGLCTGLAVLSKFSTLPYLPCAFLAVLGWYYLVERPRFSDLLNAAAKRFLPFCFALAVGALVIWAGYRFSFGHTKMFGMSVPAPALFDGIVDVMGHDSHGHPSFLLGMHSMHGWWYYFPVVLAVKTPIPLLAALGFGIAALWKKQGWAKVALGCPLAFSAAILFYALFSHINIGLRHILPVYVGMSIVAAAGLVRLLDLMPHAKWAAWTLGIILVWSAGTSLLSHPDYIPYFNFFAGSEPENIVADSDLDWGQDMKRLAEKLHEVHATHVTFNPFIVAYLEQVHGFPPIQQMDPENPSPGWNAVSLTVLKVARLGLEDKEPGVQLWPEHIAPTARVGKTTLLYYFPPTRR